MGYEYIPFVNAYLIYYCEFNISSSIQFFVNCVGRFKSQN